MVAIGTSLLHFLKRVEQGGAERQGKWAAAVPSSS